MATTAVENLIINSIHGAFIKYPEGDGGPNLDYEWITPDQSAHIAKGSRGPLGLLFPERLNRCKTAI